ncbi:MAG: transglutaminase-like domain-containing protein, partial [Clostridia bacterium]
YESNYPYYSLKWSTPNIDKYAITDIIVTINGKKYALSDSFYAKYFSDNCLNLTSLLLPNSKLHIFVAVAVGSNIYTSAECVYDNNPDGSLVKYFTTTYDYFGKTINTYLRDDEEVTDLIYYAILHYDSLDVYDGDKLDEKGNIYQKMIKVYYAQGAEKLMPIIQNARASFPEAVSWYSSLQFKATSPSEITFCVTMRSTVTPTLVTSEPTCKSEQKNNDTHFGNGRRKIAYPTFDKVPFKIMQKYNFVLVQSTTELVMALERGLRPKFVVGSVVESVYNEAKKVLYEIVDDEMNDYAKVEAIYDWLSNNIMYDYKIATLSGELLPNDPRYIELYCNRAFFAEGVFFNKLAVCNGIAQAFVIMCRIEGIRAFKVTGSANGGAHAWNKVCIDGN